MADLFGCAPSPGALASMTSRIAHAVAPALEVIRTAVAGAGVAHFDETGFRVAGRLAWVHSASSGKYVLVTVHAKRGKEGMDAAGVLPAFGGIACHDAWAPYDCYQDLAGHALCCAHVLRELTAVAEAGTDADVTWVRGDLGVGVVDAGERECRFDPVLEGGVQHGVVAVLVGVRCDPPADVDVVGEQFLAERGAGSHRV
jgi:hypothetical protein